MTCEGIMCMIIGYKCMIAISMSWISSFLILPRLIKISQSCAINSVLLNWSSTVETTREQHENWDSYDWHLHLRGINALIFARWLELYSCVCRCCWPDDDLHEQRKHPSGSVGCVWACLRVWIKSDDVIFLIISTTTFCLVELRAVIKITMSCEL